MTFQEVIKDLYKRPTFVSIVGGILFLLSLIVMLYQILFTDLGGGASLGLTIEIIGAIILFFLLVLDRFLLKDFKRIKLSVFEGIVIIGFYYIIS